MRHVWHITLLVVVCIVANETTENCVIKFCISEGNYDIVKSACNRMGKERCVVESSALHCIENVEDDIADFVLAEPEEAVLGSMLKLNNTMVLGYLKPASEKSDVNFNTVILTNNKSKVQDLNGLNYCHLGNEVNIPPSVLRKFESYVWRRKNVDLCHDKHAAAVENYIYNMNETFGSSCIPGLWSADYRQDRDLKKRFPKLLELCDTYQNESNAFIQSLNCLTSGQGDIALTMLEEFILYKQKRNLSNEDYFYLCEDGTVQDLNNTCVWSKHTWPLLLANKNVIDEIKMFLKQLFPNEVLDFNQTTVDHFDYNHNSSDFNDLLKNMLFKDSRTLHFVNSTNLREYIEAFGPITNEETMCQQGLKWCTRNEQETKQCMFLQKASQLYGIEPRIEQCEQNGDFNSTEDGCINSLMMNYTDIAYIDSNQMYNSRKQTNKEKLDVVLYTNEDPKYAIRSLLVINPSTIKNKADLKSKRACFSEFGSIDWVSFIDVFKDYITSTSCYYYERLSSFVDRSCAFDTNLQDVNTGVNHLCALCESTIQSSAKHSCKYDLKYIGYAGNQAALNCLTNMKADYAVLRVEKDLQLPINYMIMCKNGTLANTLNVDDDCFLAISPAGAIMVNENNKLKKAIQVAFREIEKASYYPTKFPFNPFEKCKGVSCSLFAESTKGFYSPDTSTSTRIPKYIQENVDLLERIDTCSKRLRIEEPNDEADDKSSGFLSVFFAIVGMGTIFGAAVFGWFKVKDQLQNNTDNSPNQNDDNEGGVEMKIIPSNSNRSNEQDDEEDNLLQGHKSEDTKNKSDVE